MLLEVLAPTGVESIDFSVGAIAVVWQDGAP